MIKVTLKDGSVREVEKGKSIRDVAKSISQGLAKEAIIGIVDGEVKPLSFPLEKDCELEICNFEDERARETFRQIR